MKNTTGRVMRSIGLNSIFALFLVACATSVRVIPPTTTTVLETRIAATNPAILTPTLTPTLAPTSTRIPTLTMTPTATPLIGVKVLSYNLLYGGGVERQWDSALPIALVGKDRLPEILSFIKQAQPDIWGVEEANGWDRGTPSIIQQVAQELGMNYYLAKTPGGFNLGFLTRFKIVETENFSSEVGKQGALRATLLAPDGELLNVFLVHLDPNSTDARWCEVNTLIQRMNPYTRQRTILIGDMNFQPGSREYARLEQAAWVPVITEPSWGIDQIWLFPSITWSTTAWFNALNLPSGVSDHSPIGAEIKLSPKSAVISTPIPVFPTPTIQLSSIVLNTLASVQILRRDDFDDPCAFTRWNSRWTAEKISSGMLEITGETSWQAFATRYKEFSEGQGAILRFQAASESEFEIYYDSGAWETDNYRRYGIHVGDNRVQSVMWQGPLGKRIEKFSPELELVSTHWYMLLLALGKHGEKLVQIWDPAKPAQTYKSTMPMNETWAGLPWLFRIGVNKDTVLIDDFTEISFDEIIH